VERGKSLVGDQSQRVAAAVDAGKQAYRSASTTAATSTSGTGSTGTPASSNS
jgi:hypothetical protein